MSAIAGLWVVEAGGEENAPPTLTKPAGARHYLAFDFGNLPAVAGGSMMTEAALDVSPAGTLTVGDVELLGYRGGDESPYRAAVWVEGGTAGTTYTLAAHASFDDGSEWVGVGLLTVTPGG